MTGRRRVQNVAGRRAPARPAILLLSGPNLGLLGERQPEIYGAATLAEHVGRAEQAAARSGCDLKHLQSEHEADLIAAVHAGRGSVAAIVVNAGALSHSAGRFTTRSRPSTASSWSFTSPIRTHGSRGGAAR